MSTASKVIDAIQIAERVASAIISAFPGVDRAKVLRVARDSVRALPTAGPDEAGAFARATKVILGDADERSELDPKHDTDRAPPPRESER